jgi:D-3-phosphoglycerate dehydrogenase / 2-oxoglutarate reductase
MQTVLLADPIHEVGRSRLARRFDVAARDASGDDSAHAFESADCMVVRTFVVKGELMDRMPRLKLVLKHGAGVDNIDIPAATQRGILVGNTPGGNNATAVAEGSFALMLSVLRSTREMDRCVREDRYADRWKIQLRDLWGATLGLVGFGKIARVAARIAQGFDMTVLAYDPFVGAEEMTTHGVRKAATLDELLGEADVVSLHVGLTDATAHLIDAGALSKMKRNAILINTSRGEVVDEKALVEALRERRIGGAGLDVLDPEPPARNNPLFELPGVVLSPHVAGVTEASMRDMALNVAKFVEDVADGRQPSTLLNPQLWSDRKS